MVCSSRWLWSVNSICSCPSSTDSSNWVRRRINTLDWAHKLQVNQRDNRNRTFLHIMCYFGKGEHAYEIYVKYNSHFKFDLEMQDNDGQSIEVISKYLLEIWTSDKRIVSDAILSITRYIFSELLWKFYQFSHILVTLRRLNQLDRPIDVSLPYHD